MSVSKNKVKHVRALLSKFVRNRLVLGVTLLLLCTYVVFKNQQYAQLSLQHSQTVTTDFRNQYYQGKACGLLTAREATELLATPVGTNGTIIAANSPMGSSRPGSPRIDSCAHTASKSSDGYIDVILKTYSTKKDAAKYYVTDLPKYFPTEARDAGNLGDKLRYGADAYYLLQNNQVLEISASKTPRISEPGAEQFTRIILEKVVAKL